MQADSSKKNREPASNDRQHPNQFLHPDQRKEESRKNNFCRGLDLSKEYGIVLEGGGAKGSYQVGVWQALSEAGVKIKGIAGASVGALNGALMCQGELKKAEKLWSSISYGKVLAGSDSLLAALSEHTSVPAKKAADEAKQVIEGGGFDISPLKRLIAENINPAAIKASPRELYAVTFSLEERRQLTIDIRALPEEKMCDMLLASAYLPGFRQEKLQGQHFLDGGMLNSVPVDVLLERGYQDIIVIRIYGVGITRPVRIPKGVHLYEISPADSIGGLLEFDRRQSVRNMRLGYYDGLRLLHGYCGSRYYFDCDAAEAQCFDLKRMEELGEALSLDRFRVYRPEAFLKKLRRADEKQVADGGLSVFEREERQSFLKRLLGKTFRTAE